MNANDDIEAAVIDANAIIESHLSGLDQKERQSRQRAAHWNLHKAEILAESGRKGGKKRWEKLLPSDRSYVASRMAKARWDAPCAYCKKKKLQCRCGRWGKK